MITDADVKKLAKVFATKDDLDRMNRNIRHLSTTLDHAQTGIEIEVRKVERKVDDLKERLDTMEDNIVGDIATLQNENTITSSYNQRLNVVEAKLAVVS